MQLQLSVISPAGFLAGTSPGKLHCVLQTSGLPQDRSLEVSLNDTNDTLKRWQEGGAQTFSWELQEYEEVRLNLCHGAAEIAFWRGLWKENALFSLGALPVRVFFNGVEQPRPESQTTQFFDASHRSSSLDGHETVLAPLLEPLSANDQTAPPLVERTEASLQSDEHRGEVEEPYDDEDDRDDLQSWPDEEDDEGDEDDGYEEEEYLDVRQKQQESQLALEQDQPVLAEEQPDGVSPFESRTDFSDEKEEPYEEGSPPVPPAVGSSSVVLAQEAEPAEQATGFETSSRLGKVVAFYADPAWAQRTLQQLTELLTMMPRKTVIVDLREPSRQKKEEYHPLSRSYLRDAFGGRYWDRSRSITTTSRTLSQDRRSTTKRWERIITAMENPDGILALERYLRAGYSMILMDAISLDEESIRRVVMNVLQERLPGLEEMAMPH